MAALNFGDLSIDAFLRDYWQKKPLVLRGAVPSDLLPASGAEVLGFACEPDAASRLIVGAEDPELYYGPFEPEELEDLPDAAWTVLVQELDRLDAGAARLQDAFRFTPNWRMDDLMVSYAMPGGGVGAHIDQYDVFLIQGEGRRRWEFGAEPIDVPEWKEDSEVAILARFEPEHVVELEPGDVLYLPPRVAHNGVALAPCVTFSVGFRAPSRGNLLTGIAALAAERFGDADRFSDPSRTAPVHPGQIQDSDLKQLRGMVRDTLADDALMDAMLGRIITENPRGLSAEPLEEPLTADDLRELLESGARLRRMATSQFAYIPDGNAARLFVSGAAYSMHMATAEALTGRVALDGPTVQPLLTGEDAALVVELVNNGLLLVEA